MKGIFSLVFLWTCIYSVNAFSARWIVEDAKLNIQSGLHDYKIVKQFKVGSKTYTVIESQDFSKTAAEEQRSLYKATRAKTVVEDLRIRLIDPINTAGADAWTDSRPGWHVQRMKYDQLNPSYQGQGVVVGVVDTGVDITHPQLASKIWTNPNEIPGDNIDNDSNGYIDDIHGWNFVNNSPNTVDKEGHGTHCAGIIAADSNSAGTARGVAPMAQIMPIKVIGGENASYLSDVSEAIVYGANNGARILSNSWGLYGSWQGFNINSQSIQILGDAITYAYYRGVVYVASAGNNSLNLDVTNLQDLRIPLGFSGIYNMIGVASGDYDGTKDVMSYFSNYGPNYVHFATPGSGILSTVPGGWSMMSGTSMSTPLFAGIMARMISKGYTWIEAVEVLRQTADQNAQPAYDGKIRFGFVDAEAALR